MADTQGSGGARGEHYSSDQGEQRNIERGVDSLGTPAAGAGPDAGDAVARDLPAGAGHQHLEDAAHPSFHYASDAGEQRTIEQGIQLTEEGEKNAGGGEVF